MTGFRSSTARFGAMPWLGVVAAALPLPMLMLMLLLAIVSCVAGNGGP
jgi:hypothetical protein